MRKYARLIGRTGQNNSIQLVDVIDLAQAVYPSLPWNGCETDDQLLSKLFAPNESLWRADDEWFEAVPQGCQSGATFTGAWPADQMNPSKYVNPDNTDGNGNPIP